METAKADDHIIGNLRTLARHPRVRVAESRKKLHEDQTVIAKDLRDLESLIKPSTEER